MPATPTVVFDFEFHFQSGSSLFTTAQEGRDRISADDARVRLELRHESGDVEEVIVHRSTLAYMRTTKRTLEVEPPKDAEALLKLVGT